jgi:hypothetical protein
MLDLLKQKEKLLNQLSQFADTLGYTHPHTVAKSQELDVIVNKITFGDQLMKKAG